MYCKCSPEKSVHNVSEMRINTCSAADNFVNFYTCEGDYADSAENVKNPDSVKSKLFHKIISFRCFFREPFSLSMILLYYA